MTIDLTPSQETIVKAYERGYRVTESGNFINKEGRLLPVKLLSKQRYPSKQLSVSGRKRNFYIHRLAAYCFYGNDLFKQGIQVRHLNGDVLDISKGNIKLGTCSENHMDKCPKVRKACSRKAVQSRTNFTRKTLRKLSDGEALDVKMSLKRGVDGVTLAKKYGVSDETIYQIKNGETYKDIKIGEDAE